ncbi:hypothetical protein [uncultured Mediterranean phage uvDeep-CGR2-KM19-C37]|nr:hypothetical protein [uncultured Mediterranean phage uvDeep-CGR2-KM19-C37]
MPDIKALRREFDAAQHDGRKGVKRFRENFERSLRANYHPGEFSIRKLFEEFVPDGREVIASWGNAGERNQLRGGVHLTEAEAVTTSQFSNITGQLIFSEVMDVWDNPELLAPRLARNVTTRFLDGEKYPGISLVADDASEIGEGAQYPRAGLSEEYVETPRTVKNGVIVPITKEAVIADRTGLLLDRARSASLTMAINKEKRVMDAATGQTSLYRYKGGDSDGAAIASFGNDSGDHNWDNLQASNAMADWVDVEDALLLFDGLTDPSTGEPIIVSPTQLLVPTALKLTAMRIVGATAVRYGAPGSTSVVTQTDSPNPLVSGTQYEVLSSAYVKNATSSATTWYIGDFQKMLRYMEAWPITSIEAPPNSHLEFTNDIVNQFKVSERGAVAVIEPRAAVKNTA